MATGGGEDEFDVVEYEEGFKMVEKYNIISTGGLSLSQYSIRYKWKNHFHEMKGDVGMSGHEKKGNKKMPTPRQKVIHNPIPTSLFLLRS